MIIKVYYKNYWVDIETNNFRTIEELVDYIIEAEKDIKKAEKWN